MDGFSNGKPYEQMDDLGGKPTIFGNTHIFPIKLKRFPAAMLPSKKKKEGHIFPSCPSSRVPRSAGFIQPAASSLAHAPWGRSSQGGVEALRVGFGDVLLPIKTWVGSGKIYRNSMDNPRNSGFRCKKRILILYIYIHIGYLYIGYCNRNSKHRSLHGFFHGPLNIFRIRFRMIIHPRLIFWNAYIWGHWNGRLVSRN